MASRWGVARELLGEAARLLVPLSCAGCAEEDVALCEACSAPWWDDPWRADDRAPRLDIAGRSRLPVWTVVPLDGATHRAMSEWKDGGRRDLDRFFGEAIGRAARYVAAEFRGFSHLAVVPVPSQRRSVRRRGVDLPRLLARAAAESLPGSSRVAAVLRPVGGASRGRSSVGRWDAAGVRVVARGGREPVLIVDDVITTGASIARAADALEQAGFVPVASLTLAATPPRDSRSPAALL